jgi:malate dehydrogenase (oxaloacetate-decarboxylating)
MISKTDKEDEGLTKALRLHAHYRGKIQTFPKVPVRGLEDFAVWYTPGVADPCRAIAASPEDVFTYTNRGNTLAVLSDGSRVLGLGDIGPEAGLPVIQTPRRCRRGSALHSCPRSFGYRSRRRTN